MHIVVCIKQVPDSAQIRVHPVTNTIMRQGVPTIINPYDLFALEEALRMRDRFGGEVTVLTMGPQMAEDSLRKAMTFGADRGVLLQATDDLEARGHVRVVADDGAVLRTEVLFWDHQRSRIHTDEPVEITRGEDVLQGVGLEADPGLSNVDLKREVRGRVRSAPESLLPEGGS